MKARIATYSNLAKMADASNLPFLHSALRTEHDPVMRAIIADAIFKSDKESGAAVLLDAVPTDAATFAQLRTIAQQMAVPTPTVSALIDIAADGNPDALDKIIVVAHQTKGDASVDTMLSDGLQEIGRTAPEELFDALKRTPGDIAIEAIALLGQGINGSEEKASHPFLEHLKTITDVKTAANALSLSDKLRGFLAVPARLPVTAQPDVKAASAPELPGGG
jgi:D-alanyl-D-alanine carboxypeptidase/D-alanyl-D-alanine-endopeptidase (penicillin-binding protein 4)